jgi:hypothetical protein
MGSINIISKNTIYTAPAGATVIGITFAPQTNYPAELTPPPILTAQTTAPVSSLFSVTNTPDDGFWRSNITVITVNGSLLPSTAYNTNQAGKLVFDPSLSGGLLTTSGFKTIVISATGYSTNSIVQSLTGGAAAKLVIATQPAAPAADGGKLATQPVVAVQDQFGNATTSTATITAAPVQGTWTLSGTTSKAAISGTATFTDLAAFANSAVTGATIAFTSSGLTSVTNSAFNIPAPVLAKLSATTLTGGKLTFSFTNFTGLNFSVLATNNITAPEATWPVIGAVVESPVSSGTYRFTNSTPATNGALFFILRQP